MNAVRAAFLGGLLAALVVTGCTERQPPDTPAAPEADAPAAPASPAVPAAAPGTGPVLVIGADGLDLRMLRPLARAGKLPNITDLMEKGSHGVLLSEREMRSPPLWTTIATGRPRDVHGIYDFVTASRLWPRDLRKGKRKLVTSSMRKVSALWNIASKAGREVAVVGWLNTWPAERVRGVMVSPYVALGSRKQITIKGAVYRDVPRQVFPEERWDELRDLIVSQDEVPDELVHSFAPEPGNLIQDHPLLARCMRGLRWSLGHTLTMKNITLHLLEHDAPDLVMVYFEGSDSLGHRFWLFRQPIDEIVAQLEAADLPTGHAKELAARYGRVVDRYYVLLDAVIGELVGALPPDGRVVVISDHGFGDRTLPPLRSVPYSGEHKLEGTIIVAGPGIRSGGRMVGATHYNVTPTILDMLHIESDIPFEANSLLPQLKDRTDREALGTGDTPGPGGEQESDEMPFGEEEIERLRSLGYVE